MTELSAVSPLSNRIVAGFLPGWQQPLAIIEVDIPADLDIASRLSSLHSALRATVRGLVVPTPPALRRPISWAPDTRTSAPRGATTSHTTMAIAGSC